MTDEKWATFWLVVAVVCMAVLWLLLAWIKPALAQHRPQDMDLHHQFYSSWMMPDNRAVSCCHDEDCFPAQSKRVDGQWYARKTDDEEWIPIPASKVEQDRDTPDGRSHLCGRKYNVFASGFVVFCFIAGSGS